MRLALEQDGNIIQHSRHSRRYIVRPKAQIVYAFTDEGQLRSKYQYITERIEYRDNSLDDLREYHVVIKVGIKLEISEQERIKYGTVDMTQ